MAAGAAVAVALSASHTSDVVGAHPWAFGAFLATTFGLQLASVEIYGRGTYSFAGSGMLATGFAFGPGAAMLTGLTMGITHGVRRRAKPHRVVFDMAQWTLASGAGALVYRGIGAQHLSTVVSMGPALLASAVFLFVNAGLLSLAMGLSEGEHPLAVWRARLSWMTPYALASGPLGVALVVAYEKVGTIGLLAFALPPAFMMVSVRQYLAKTRESVEEVRQANEELQAANAELATRNADLRDLFDFAAGLTALTHDAEGVAAYAEEALARLVGSAAVVRVGRADGDGVVLSSRGRVVGEVTLAGGDTNRWNRLREAIVPQLATALESATLAEEVRRTHLETIAALSRSMEAKDFYTGGHTERVSAIAVALAKRCGYSGSDLDAIEIGALLHDIGKIGIPERILHKPGPLDDEEWTLMKQHPVISEFILSGVNLPRIVLEIARHSHERIDGRGYPDGLAGDDIPLPARIVLVADAWDALTSDRPYRRARDSAAALDELLVHSGTQFCPQVVAAMEQVYREDPAVLAAPGRLAVVA
ncbi:MAG: HD-GYP domain-containing protein [Actinobacteria bacterium]|nr:HD-GYP domain-containing protein [Actinomycetota bacterium]